MPNQPLDRRSFLKMAALNLGALWLPARLPTFGRADQWPSVALDELPAEVAEILDLTPDAFIDPQGYLNLRDRKGQPIGQAPLRPTRWNQERSKPQDRLVDGAPWGIILHWFGDTLDKDLDLDGYLRGFNGLRQIDDYTTRTSAHFLVGPGQPAANQPTGKIGVIQTQAPDKDGVPFIASHLRGLSFGPHEQNKQHYVRAYYQLAQQDPTIHSLLQDMYDGAYIHPNERTLAIEIAGTDFDDQTPAPQAIANVLAVVWALMERYQIAPSGILGHHELQTNKGDPGKQFMALMRFLVGVKALTQDNPLMKLLVFGRHVLADNNAEQAVRRYFKLVRDYHVLISKPDRVYQWEALTRYWSVAALIDRGVPHLAAAGRFRPPITGELHANGYEYLQPGNHEGVDLHHPAPPGGSAPSHPAEVLLVADGLCLFQGEVTDCHYGRMAIFRHQQTDGALILSAYSHLSEMGDIQPGRMYSLGFPIGRVDNQASQCGRFLHFSIAYGAAWDLDLHVKPYIPLGAGPTYIRERFLDPVAYLATRNAALRGLS